MTNISNSQEYYHTYVVNIDCYIPLLLMTYGSVQSFSTGIRLPYLNSTCLTFHIMAFLLSFFQSHYLISFFYSAMNLRLSKKNWFPVTINGIKQMLSLLRLIIIDNVIWRSLNKVLMKNIHLKSRPKNDRT